MAEAKKKENKKTLRMKKSSYYKVEGDKITRLRKSCLKCGSGVFMAEHKDRHTCGNCGYTEYKKQEKKE